MSKLNNVLPLTNEPVPPLPPPPLPLSPLPRPSGCPVGYPDCGPRDGDPTLNEGSLDRLSDTKERRTEDGALRLA